MYILFMILFAVACREMAEKRNRNPILGMFGGALFGILSVIYYLMAGPKTGLPLNEDNSDSWASQINGEDN